MNEILQVEIGETEGQYIDFTEFKSVGYAIVHKDVIYIPAIIVGEGVRMKDIIGELVKRTGINRIIFTACYSTFLKSKLRNIVREWDEWFKEVEDYSHCIEVKWE